jgi:hypothetical protein
VRTVHGVRRGLARETPAFAGAGRVLSFAVVEHLRVFQALEAAEEHDAAAPAAPTLSPEARAQILERARTTTPEQRLAWLVSAQRFEAEVRASRIAAGLPVTPRDWEAQVRLFEAER